MNKLSLCLLLVSGIPLSGVAQMQDLISFQGCLTNTAGDHVPDGTHMVVFTLYDQPTSGTVRWSEVQYVQTSNCVYHTHLGDISSLEGTGFHEKLWLGVKVGSDLEMTPRTALVSAPYALSMRGMRIIPVEAGGTHGINVVGGLPENSIAGDAVAATISGGGGRTSTGTLENVVTTSYGTVGGGVVNTVEGIAAVVTGGYGNISRGDFSAVIGGEVNVANGVHSIVGGSGNVASGTGSTISGGYANTAPGDYSAVGGGENNEAGTDHATVAGGENNSAVTGSAVGGGRSNDASAPFTTVSGGLSNMATSAGATVPGGRLNKAEGSYSLAAGMRAHAQHDGTFVWSDRSVEDYFLSSGVNQFLIRAAGGVAIGTGDPQAALHLQNYELNLSEVALHEEDFLVEAKDAVIGLYSDNLGTWGSGLTMVDMENDGTFNNKWAILRQTEGPGNNNLYFKFGTDDDQAANDTKMYIGTDGHVHADAYDTPSGDVAELFEVDIATAIYEPGDVLAISERKSGQLTLSASPYSTLVAGVYATQPGVTLNKEDKNDRQTAPLALVGVVPTKISAENGAVALGDLLVTSSTPGHAMKADKSDPTRLIGAVIGKAMERFDGPGMGMINVLVNLQ
jgi:hypothetical protein